MWVKKLGSSTEWVIIFSGLADGDIFSSYFVVQVYTFSFFPLEDFSHAYCYLGFWISQTPHVL